jgi:nitrous oxidase accessory protein NosD
MQFDLNPCDGRASILAMKYSGAAFALFLAVPAGAADIPAADALTLAAAIARAGPGDRILLARADYGDAVIGPRRGRGALTIAAANGADPPVFRSIFVREAEVLTLENLRVSFGASAAPLTDRAIEIRRSTRVRLNGLTIESSVNGVSTDDASGLIIRDSRDVAVATTSFSDVFRGAVVYDGSDVTISASRFARLGSDGVAGRGVQGLTIENNTFTDFTPADPVKWHPDAIQLWSRGAKRANERIVIRGNDISRGAGAPAQGVFLKSPEIASRDILIEGNRIEQAMGQGVFVQHASDVTIRGNTLIAAEPVLHPPAIEVRAPFANAIVEDNEAPRYRLPAGVEARGNRIGD